MKQQLAFSVLLFAFSVSTGLAQQQTVTVAEGASATVDLPFDIERYNVADVDVTSVNLLGGGRAALQGLRAGATTATFMGAGGQNMVYEVRVQTDVSQLLAAMRIALEEVPEVEMLRAGERIVVRGRVSNLGNWNQLKRVVAAFGPQVLNLATLEMPPEVLVGLRDGLRNAGFEIADSEEPAGEDAPGRLAVTGAGHTVNVAGSVYSSEQLKKIHEVIAAQRWLTVEVEGDDAHVADTPTYTASVNVSLVPLIIEVDLAFISVSDEEYQKIGVNLFEAGLLTVEAAGSFVGDVANIGTRNKGWTETDGVRTHDPKIRTRHRDRQQVGSLSYGIFSDMAGTLRFFIRDNPDRVIHRGQLHFRNGAETWRELHSGGTLKVRLTSERETSIEDIDYGFILKAKGGLKDADMASLDIEFELSTPTRMPDSEDYDLRRDRVTTAVDCAVGNTMVLGGVNSLLEGMDESGTPILRSIPLLNVFFSQRSESHTDARMLVLVSPHIVSETERARPLSEENVEVMDISEKTPREKTKEKRRRRFFFF